MMGTDLCSLLRERQYEVVETDIQEMDVRDEDLVMRTVAEVRPRIVMHLAALTDVDGCERDPDSAFRTNALGTQNVATACKQHQADMVYISTLSVFNGEKREAYTEFDTPDPRSWYSRSKYQGESFIERLLNRHYIVRAGWMFGGGKQDKKFVSKILELARQQSLLKIVDDKFGSPTYTMDLSQAIVQQLVGTGLYGKYHIVNTGAPASRYEVAQHILTCARMSRCELLPVSSAEFPLAAYRPRMEAGRNYQLELRGWNWMRPWKTALEEYISTIL